MTVESVRKDARLPLFVTLTYPDEFPDPKTSKRHLTMYVKRLCRELPACGGIWKLEPQERGAPHYHLMIWNVECADLFMFTLKAWYEIAGNGDEKHFKFHAGQLGNRPCVEEVRSAKGVIAYAAKYLGKTFEVSGWGDKWTGRFWGIISRARIPFGELREFNVSRGKAVELQRYQRRFAHIKAHGGKSVMTFCDADQWIEKLEVVPVETSDQ